MVSVDAYLKGVAALVTLAIALVALMARPRRGAVHLAFFLGLIALNQAAETGRALAQTDAERVLWFKVASVAASLDPFVLGWFATATVPRVMRSSAEAWFVGLVGGGLALVAGWGVRELPSAAPSTHVFPIALALYTAVVYATVLLRATVALRSMEVPAGLHLLPGVLLVAALPAVPRALDEIFVFIEPVLVAAGIGGSFVPLLFAVIAILVLLLVLFTRSIPPEVRRATRSVAFFAVGLAVLARSPHASQVLAQSFGAPLPDIFVLGRLETPLRWLAFGALGSVVVFGTDLLEVPVDVRRRAARLLVALGFLVIGGGALALGGMVMGSRPIDALYLIVLGGAVTLSQGFRKLVDSVASRLYAVPIPTDTESAQAFYRRAVIEILARGGTPSRDEGLERARRSLGIDRATAALIEGMAEGSSRAPLAPNVLVHGRYQVERLIGRGGSGRAFLAEDLRIHRRVVLKEVMSDEPGERDAALREARLLGALAHPNILTVHDVLPRDGGWIIVSEYVEGGTLGDALRGGAIPPDRRHMIAVGLLDAVTAVHERGIVHGDIKPENILLTPEGTPKLTDFGTARGATGKTVRLENVLVGTLAYMAPEQRRGARPTERTDVYALGLVLRALLPDGSAARIVERALCEDPADRFASGSEMRRALLEPQLQ